MDQLRGILLERWARRVLEDPTVPSAHRLPRPRLENRIPDLIERLRARLAGSHSPAWGERAARELGGSTVGIEHARERAAAHYSPTEALRELSHFRAALLELCHEHDVAVNVEESKLLHMTIDEMMTTAAGEFERAAVLINEEAMAMVAHELRNPLNAVALCAARLGRGSVDDANRIAEMLSRNAALMGRLVADLLTVSKIEAGHFHLEPIRADATEIVQETCAQFRPTAQARHIDLSSRAPGESLFVVCDRDRVLQALGNLVGNAIKFTPEGGRVLLVLERTETGCAFRVTDTGPGIAPEYAAEIFRPFWQARRTERQGTGLGLAIARGIVEAHGGSIALDASATGGAAFVFTLPAKPKLHPGLAAAR